MSTSGLIKGKMDGLKHEAERLAGNAPTRHQVMDFAFRHGPKLHKALIAASGGRLSRFSGMPIIELRTTGRKSGLQRSTMLTSPIQDEGRVVVVASKGGDSRNPEWFLNLSANPDVEVVMDGHAERMTARVASAGEKAEMWPRIVKQYRGYRAYQKRTEREIPLVICERRPD